MMGQSFERRGMVRVSDPVGNEIKFSSEHACLDRLDAEGRELRDPLTGFGRGCYVLNRRRPPGSAQLAQE